MYSSVNELVVLMVGTSFALRYLLNPTAKINLVHQRVK